MPKTDFLGLQRNIKNNNVSSIYIIVGEESYLAQRSVEVIKKNTGSAVNEAMDFQHFIAKETKSNHVIDSLNNISLFSPHTLIMLQDADKLSSIFQDELIDYASNPNPNSTLIIKATKIDGRSKFMQKMKSMALIVECKPLYPNKIPDWINMEIKQCGKQISLEAARFMGEMMGTDLGTIAQAIERVLLFIGQKKIIDMADVEKIVSETTQRTVFELTDSIGNATHVRSNQLLNNILDHGGSPIMVLSMIARHFRILAKAKDVMGRMTDKAALAKYLGVHPFFVHNYAKQANTLSSTKIQKIFHVLFECDKKLKSSRLSAQLILQKAILSIIQ